ncbi:hypothetical protein JL720_2621 [Aureococcus anophagefferens]|nr:hypothetical protein JL720_2621 [Aureococcus anophagefferens]
MADESADAAPPPPPDKAAPKGEATPISYAVDGGSGAVTLAMMPFLPHTDDVTRRLGRFDRLCLTFLRFVVGKRRKAFWCVTGGYIFLALVGMAAQSLVLSPQYQYAWIINEKRATKYRDMRLEAVEEVDALSAVSDPSRRSQYDLLGTWIEYKGPGGHVFTPETLRTICAIESAFYRQKEWSKVCMIDAGGACVAPQLSVLRKFYGDAWMGALVTGGSADCDLLDAAAVDATWSAMVAAANSSVAGLLENGVYMENGALEAGATTKAEPALVGQPLEGYDSTTDDTEAQLLKYLDFFGDVELDCGEWLRMQEMDSVYMLFTILFVTFWVRIHTGSCAYTAACMAQILMSVPITAFVYRFVFRFEYFAFLHLCSIFFVLGIGADDNFVLLDAWKQSFVDVPEVESPDETTLRRLLYSFSRTMEAVFNTSLTTAVAFLCLGLSPLMPKVAPEGGGDTQPKAGFRLPSVEPFFEHVYLPAMKWHPTPGERPFPLGAACCAGAFLGLGILNVYFAGQLDMPKDQEEFFPDAHMFSGFLGDMQEDYIVGAASEYCEVFYTFGIDGLGKEDYNDVTCFYEEFEAWKAAGLGTATVSLGNATRAEFDGEVRLFRSTTYPGMVYGAQFDGTSWKDYVGVVDGSLRYVTVPTYLTMKLNRGIRARKKVINRVVKFTEARQGLLPAQGGHLSYDGAWQFLWCDTFIELRASLFEGFYICFPIAFGVLIFATENVLVSLYSIVGIAFVVASVLGTAQSVFGWDLGIIESLAGVMVIGFSVDYTIHLGHMYVAADKEHGAKHRLDRFAFSIEKMGPTVVGGAVTTLGAGAFMLPCQLQFFFKLGLLIFTTMLYSFLFAFGFVMPLLAAAGPSGDAFSIRPALRARGAPRASAEGARARSPRQRPPRRRRRGRRAGQDDEVVGLLPAGPELGAGRGAPAAGRRVAPLRGSSARAADDVDVARSDVSLWNFDVTCRATRRDVIGGATSGAVDDALRFFPMLRPAQLASVNMSSSGRGVVALLLSYLFPRARVVMFDSNPAMDLSHVRSRANVAYCVEINQ